MEQQSGGSEHVVPAPPNGVAQRSNASRAGPDGATMARLTDTAAGHRAWTRPHHRDVQSERRRREDHHDDQPGAALAEYDRRVLLVDFDPQGSLPVGLGVNPHTLSLSIYNLLMSRDHSIDEVIGETNVPGLDILPSNIDLSAWRFSWSQRSPESRP